MTDKIIKKSKIDKKAEISKAVIKQPVRLNKGSLSKKTAISPSATVKQAGSLASAQPAPRNNNASLFPKIYRFITESWKFILSSFVSGLIIIGILIQGTQLYNNFQEQQRIKAKRGSVENELAFWKKQLTKYKDSRDIYFRIAALEYELGDKESARVDLEKVLEIDPNLKEGREMEKILE